MPAHDFTYDWYRRAYSILRYSKNENGFIPLSEILAYTKTFDLIGTREEFVSIVRGLDVAENNYFNKVNKTTKEEK